MFSLDLDAPAQRDGRSIHANYRKACCQSNGNRGTQVVRERATTQITFQHQKKRERRNSISFFIHIAYMFSLDLDAPAQRDGRSIHANHRKACCQPNGNRGTQVVRERATTQITFQHQKKRDSISFFVHIAASHNNVDAHVMGFIRNVHSRIHRRCADLGL